MPVNIAINAEGNNQFDFRRAGPGRMQWTEKVRGRHFWPIYTLICGLMFVALCVGIVWAQVTGRFDLPTNSKDTPPMWFLFIVSLGMAGVCLAATFAHFVQHARKVRYGPAVLNLPDTLRGGQPVKLSFSKPMSRSGQGSDQPGEVRARLELIETSREAPHRDSDFNEKDAQGNEYFPALRTLWQETLRPVPVAPDAGFAAEWEFTPPDLTKLSFKPNALYGHLILTIEMRRQDKDFLEPLQVLLPLK